MRLARHLLFILLLAAVLGSPMAGARTAPVIVDHTSADLQPVPASAIGAAKTNLHIAYGHTSHGSQLVDGMAGLRTFAGAPLPPATYAFNEGGTGGALDLDDYFVDGDLGNPDFTAWATGTRQYLGRAENRDVSVVLWSWCGEVSWATEANINTYLSLMAGLERDYPAVTFVYMTGHLDGSGTGGNLNARNNQIRNYCRANNRVLYDFADIESYDPDGIGYLARGATDACDYDGGNWARTWQASHVEGRDWYGCAAAHTEPLNANRKAYAAWHLFARLAGWSPGTTPATPTITPVILPGTVEAEYYAPEAFHDTTPGNQGGACRQDDVDIEAIPGGYAVCYVRDGEWLEYNVTVDRTAAYRLEARVASPTANGRLEVLVDRGTAFTIAAPNTGGYGTYTTIVAPEVRSLAAGPHTLTVRFSTGYLNLDRLAFTGLPIALPLPVPGATGTPQDLDGDGGYEDVNGNGRHDFADVVLFFNQMTWIAGNEPLAAFDFNANGRIDFADAVCLFNGL